MITAVLDANVLYPAPLRDYLLHLAALRLYNPVWTEQIHEEWITNLLQNRPDLKRSDLDKTRQAMNNAFPGACVKGYRKYMSEIVLPDPDDKHVLAAAIASKAALLITNNLKDFPSSALAAYHINALSADNFVLQLITTDKISAVTALANQVKFLKNPPLSTEDVLRNLENCGLQKSVLKLREYI